MFNYTVLLILKASFKLNSSFHIKILDICSRYKNKYLNNKQILLNKLRAFSGLKTFLYDISFFKSHENLVLYV